MGIDTDKKTFARERGKWYSREDVTEIGKNDRRKMIDQLTGAGFTELERM